MKRQINLIKMAFSGVLFIFLITGFSSFAISGGDEGLLKEKLDDQSVEIHLHGIESFGAVQLFDFLLAKVSGVSEIHQTGVSMMPGQPEACHSSWNVLFKDGDIDYLQGQLYNIIKDLDPDSQNDILYEAPFIVMKEDMMLLKQVKPVLASAGYIAFGFKAEVDDRLCTVCDDLPWYKQSDAGFE